jgi:hypothetical protein
MYAYFINQGDNTISRVTITAPHSVDSTVSAGGKPAAIFLDSVRFCAYTVNSGDGQSAIAVAVAQFISSPNPTVPTGKDPFHAVTPYAVAEKLGPVALFVPLTIQERVPGNPELVSRIQRQLWGGQHRQARRAQSLYLRWAVPTAERGRAVNISTRNRVIFGRGHSVRPSPKFMRTHQISQIRLNPKAATMPVVIAAIAKMSNAVF